MSAEGSAKPGLKDTLVSLGRRVEAGAAHLASLQLKKLTAPSPTIGRPGSFLHDLTRPRTVAENFPHLVEQQRWNKSKAHFADTIMPTVASRYEGASSLEGMIAQRDSEGRVPEYVLNFEHATARLDDGSNTGATTFYTQKEQEAALAREREVASKKARRWTGKFFGEAAGKVPDSMVVPVAMELMMETQLVQVFGENNVEYVPATRAAREEGVTGYAVFRDTEGDDPNQVRFIIPLSCQPSRSNSKLRSILAKGVAIARTPDAVSGMMIRIPDKEKGAKYDAVYATVKSVPPLIFPIDRERAIRAINELAAEAQNDSEVDIQERYWRVMNRNVTEVLPNIREGLRRQVDMYIKYVNNEGWGPVAGTAMSLLRKTGAISRPHSRSQLDVLREMKKLIPSPGLFPRTYDQAITNKLEMITRGATLLLRPFVRMARVHVRGVDGNGLTSTGEVAEKSVSQDRFRVTRFPIEKEFGTIGRWEEYVRVDNAWDWQNLTIEPTHPLYEAYALVFPLGNIQTYVGDNPVYNFMMQNGGRARIQGPSQLQVAQLRTRGMIWEDLRLSIHPIGSLEECYAELGVDPEVTPEALVDALYKKRPASSNGGTEGEKRTATAFSLIVASKILLQEPGYPRLEDVVAWRNAEIRNEQNRIKQRAKVKEAPLDGIPVSPASPDVPPKGSRLTELLPGSYLPFPPSAGSAPRRR